jgi:hypothetical protein
MKVKSFVDRQEQGSAMIIVLLLIPVLTGIGLAAYYYSKALIPLELGSNAEMQCRMVAESVYEDLADEAGGGSSSSLFDFFTPSGSSESVETTGPVSAVVGSHQKYGGLNYQYKQVKTVTTTTTRFFFSTTTTTEVKVEVTARAYNKSGAAWDDAYYAEKYLKAAVGDDSDHKDSFFFF